MDEVKQQLQRLKKENHDLEKELRGALLLIMVNIVSDCTAENVNMEQKARLMETRVVESAETIENLRRELSLLSTELRGALFVIMVNISPDNFAENANMEQKARLMETRAVENAETIKNLRQELSLLSTDHKVLQRRFTEISEVSQLLDRLKSQSDMSRSVDSQ